jgi:endonuclease YncB( thermonuclease family)
MRRILSILFTLFGVAALIVRQRKQAAERPLLYPFPSDQAEGQIAPPEAVQVREEPSRDAAESVPAGFSGLVHSVLGGDRLMVQRHASEAPVYVRLWGIIAPQSGQPFADKAVEFVRQQLVEHSSQIEVEPKLPSTDDEHLIAAVQIGGQSLNLALVEAGLAWWHRDLAPEANELELAELRARLAGRGLWQDPNPVEPWNLNTD